MFLDLLLRIWGFYTLHLIFYCKKWLNVLGCKKSVALTCLPWMLGWLLVFVMSNFYSVLSCGRFSAQTLSFNGILSCVPLTLLAILRECSGFAQGHFRRFVNGGLQCCISSVTDSVLFLNAILCIVP